jgi:hypothetical protein
MAAAVRYRRETGWPVAKVDDDVQARTGWPVADGLGTTVRTGWVGLQMGWRTGAKRTNYEELISSGSYCGPDERTVQPSSGATGSVHL